MSDSDSANFTHHYQNLYFKLSEDDNFTKCANKRRLMALTYAASRKLNKPDTTAMLLDNDLKEYCEMIDYEEGSNSVNNYAEQCLFLASTCENKSNGATWKSSAFEMKDEIIKGFNQFQNISITDKDLKMLTKSKDLKLLESKAQEMESKHKHINNDKNIQLNEKPSNEENKTDYVADKQSSFRRTKSLNQNNTSAFRTAKTELIIQQMKKNNKQKTGQEFMYGNVKKSLGTRRGLNNKFIPPVLSNKSEGDEIAVQSTPPQEDECVDPRLQHIDPKMVELIKNEIMDTQNKLDWDDIAGLDFAKSSIQESVVWPLLRPDIFTGLRRPPKGILLFGPPGTGKTLIGKCIASQSGSTFFSISASSLTSKWVGDGEKMVRALFTVASVYQPAVVFIDEIDSLLSQRSDTEHESSRRMKTEFLVQLDGAGTGENDRILVIGATNRPQELDEAARRRLVKRLYIPLPDESARIQMVTRLMQSEKHLITEQQMTDISHLTEGYSGSDMKNLCQEASLGPIRTLDFRAIQNIKTNEVPPITFQDFETALKRVRASVSQLDLDQYVKWNDLFGSG